MTEQAEVHPSPHHSESTPELPPGAIVGDELYGYAARTLRAACIRNYLPEEYRLATEAHLRRLITARPGEPVLELNHYHDGQVRRLYSGGRLTSPMYGTPFSNEINVLHGNTDMPSSPDMHTSARISFNVADMGYGFTPDEVPHVVVGEDAVRALCQEIVVPLRDPDVHVENCAGELEFMQGYARTGLPFEYFDFTDEQRYELCSRLLTTVVAGGNATVQPLAFDVLCYAADISEPQQRETLIEAMREQWVACLPLRPGDPDGEAVNSVRHLSHRLPLSGEWAEIEPRRIGHETRTAILMSDLYLRRSRLEQTATQQPTPPLEPLEVTEPLPVQELECLRGMVGSREVRADVAYLRHQRAAGLSVEAAVPGHDQREAMRQPMRLAARNMTTVLIESNAHEERLAILEALEYLLGAETARGRNDFYEELTHLLADQVPLVSAMSNHRYASVARAMGDRMPNPPLDEHSGELLQGDARAAAIVAELYRKRAEHLFAAQRRHMSQIYGGGG